MEVVIIYDSEYPSTKITARAIGKGFKRPDQVRIADAKVLEGKTLPEFKILIVGSPDLRSKMSKSIKAFLNKLPKNSLQNVAIAAFETRMKRGFLSISLFGGSGKKKRSAANSIDAILFKKGGIQVMNPQTFYYKSQLRPYNDHELYRAGKWGREIDEIAMM